MGITRTVTTQVYCDVCGKWVIGWESEETGVSREWAKSIADIFKQYKREERKAKAGAKTQAQYV